MIVDSYLCINILIVPIMSNYVIYKLTSPSGKIYIGRTNDFDKRMISHKSWSVKKDGEKRPLYKAIRFHGWDNFIKEIIDTVETEQESVAKELEYIVKFNSVREGYNSTYETNEGGDNWEGKRDTKEYRAFVRKMKKINAGEGNGMHGKTHKEETKLLQKEKAKGRFSLPWFIEKYGEREGYDKYHTRCEALSSRKMKRDSNGVFIKKKI